MKQQRLWVISHSFRTLGGSCLLALLVLISASRGVAQTAVQPVLKDDCPLFGILISRCLPRFGFQSGRRGCQSIPKRLGNPVPCFRRTMDYGKRLGVLGHPRAAFLGGSRLDGLLPLTGRRGFLRTKPSIWGLGRRRWMAQGVCVQYLPNRLC